MSDPYEPRPGTPPAAQDTRAGSVGTEPLPPPPDREPPARPRRGGLGIALLSALIAAVVAAGVAVPVTLSLTEEAPEEAPAPAEPAAPVGGDADIADIAEALLPSVARVDVVTARGQGSGSAVVYRADGYLLTNAHVVDQATEVEVTLPDGTSLDAEVVGGDEFHDLAVLRVDVEDVPAGELPAPPFADDQPRVGETAIAIGSPFEFDGSVTAGIVSGLGRSIPGTPLRDLIQTDAPINPGNSGGALANERGEVIGINTAIVAPGAAGQQRGNVGIGFAIPITNAAPVADQLIEQGFVRHAQLGVQAQNVDPRVAEAYGLGVQEGALVVDVMPGSAADEAGLQRGDIITALDGEPVASVIDLVAAIRAHEPGDDVEVEFMRAGEAQRVTATLGEADAG